MLELQGVSGGEADKPEDLEEPPARKLRRAQASSSLQSVFDKIVDGQASTSLSSAPMGAAFHLETYCTLERPKLFQEAKPLQYCGVNKVCFPTLAQISQRYLSVKGCLAQCHILQMKTEPGSQLIMQRSFFSSKRTCLFFFFSKKA